MDLISKWFSIFLDYWNARHQLALQIAETQQTSYNWLLERKRTDNNKNYSEGGEEMRKGRKAVCLL